MISSIGQHNLTVRKTHTNAMTRYRRTCVFKYTTQTRRSIRSSRRRSISRRLCLGQVQFARSVFTYYSMENNAARTAARPDRPHSRWSQTHLREEGGGEESRAYLIVGERTRARCLFYIVYFSPSSSRRHHCRRHAGSRSIAVSDRFFFFVDNSKLKPSPSRGPSSS